VDSCKTEAGLADLSTRIGNTQCRLHDLGILCRIARNLQNTTASLDEDRKYETVSSKASLHKRFTSLLGSETQRGASNARKAAESLLVG